MFEFVFGVITGRMLFGEKKESDAEFKARKAKRDRQRSAITLSKDLSKLSPLIEGLVSNIEPEDSAKWHYPFQVVTVGDWKFCLSSDVNVSIGSVIRVVRNSRVRVDGIWHKIPMRVTKLQVKVRILVLFIRILSILVLASTVLYSLSQLLQLTYALICREDVNMVDLGYWFCLSIITGPLVFFRWEEAISFGFPGCWRHGKELGS